MTIKISFFIFVSRFPSILHNIIIHYFISKRTSFHIEKYISILLIDLPSYENRLNFRPNRNGRMKGQTTDQLFHAWQIFDRSSAKGRRRVLHVLLLFRKVMSQVAAGNFKLGFNEIVYKFVIVHYKNNIQIYTFISLNDVYKSKFCLLKYRQSIWKFICKYLFLYHFQNHSIPH